ncbi:hypothetical protein IWX49DRAFT_119329 [Phyllosticta citricarpa]|uniref:IPT/TIG domain-containing protein n=1 Tax=Phyllosticta paracitricarpa TaxID=2016321 RepID=A0ABR1N0I0_9PEZI
MSENVHIMDSEMDDFDTAMNDHMFDPFQFINTDAFVSSPAPGAANACHSPAKPLLSHREQTPALPQTNATLQPRSAMSSSSPESSSQDSASETSGRRKRKLNSSESSPATNSLFNFETSSTNKWARDESQGAYANSPHSEFAPLVKEETRDRSVDVDLAHHSMSNPSFGYTPSPIGSEQLALGNTIAPGDMNLGNGPLARQYSNAVEPNYLLSSREHSPMSGISCSQNASPAAPLPDRDMFSGNFALFPSANTTAGMPNTAWQGNMSPGNLSNPRPQGPQSLYPEPALPLRYPNTLWIHQDGNKSRVETQINIRMTMNPFPDSVTRLHLPTHSISKPKLLAKQRTKDATTLELHTYLVCASAMEKPELLERALDRAASFDSNDIVTGKMNASNTYTSEENPEDPEKPLNGGPIRICNNCVQRERKRAARKRVKKQEDEEQWAKYEYDRVIVFNDKEYKEWGPPAPAKTEGVNYNRFPPGSKQIEVPMRIACYCRHQQEKSGFQVIFTIKDHQNQVLAQSITCPILITDDHKTNNGPSNFDAGSQFNINPSAPPPPGPPSGRDSDMQTTLARRPYHSTNDLPGLSNGWTGNSRSGFNQNGGASQGSSSTLTPRHASRQASPVAPQHGPNKKRKSSSSTHSHKLPRELTMTRVNNQTSPTASGDLPGLTTTLSQGVAPQNAPFMSPNDPLYGLQPLPTHNHFPSNPPTPGSTGPITPNRAGSIDNAQYQFYSSVPTSVNQSRAPSPSLGRQAIGTFQPAAMNGLMNSAINMPQSRPDHAGANPEMPPQIYKLMPSEYSKAGGIEVSCLGSNFTRNMDVYFGDQLATTTTFWNSQLMVCLLPPAPCAGTVQVTIRVHGQPAFSPTALVAPSATFTYTNDDDLKVYELAVRLLCQKETGQLKHDDARNFARSVINRFSTSWTGMSGAGGGGHMQQRNLSGAEAEEVILGVLTLIDMDDSPYVPDYEIKNKSGATMLSLACCLGYSRVVAGLLARGANPDTRDVCGYTPLMMAAMHGHGQIVRLLILRGADPTLRTLQGYNAMDVAKTRDVRDALVRVQSHRRTRSAGSASLSLRSRASSVSSMRSLWESASPSHMSDFSAVDADHEDEGEDSDESEEEVAAAWTASRRGSAKSVVLPPSHQDQSDPSIAPPAHTWRQNLSAQIHSLQQNMPWNMRQLQLPNFAQFPNIPGYQGHQVMQRISSLVPHRNNPPRSSSSSTSDETARPSTDSKWRDLFSTSSAPPAYDEIYPENKTRDLDVKKRSVAQATADHLLDQACEAEFDSVKESEESSTGISVPKVEFGKKTLTKKQQKRVRRAHAHKMKQMRSDRNLFFIWIPLLLIVLAIMLHSHLDQLLAATSVVVCAVKGCPQMAPSEALGAVPPVVNQRAVEVQ